MAKEAGHGAVLLEAARGRGPHLGAFSVKTAANTGFVVGLALGWTSSALAVQEEGVLGFDVSVEEWSWVSSLFAVGGAVGALSVGKLVHSLGRRVVILAFGPTTLLAWALLVWASAVWMLYAGRLLLGVACGTVTVATPIYVSEMSQPSVRGALAIYFQVLVYVGILVVYALIKFMSVFWMTVVCMAYSAVHIACFVWFPDTPRWYLLHGRDGDARRALLFSRGPAYDPDAELRLIKEGIQANASVVGGWRAFAAPGVRKALTITIILMTMQEATGVSAITFYASQLFKEAGAFDAYSACIVVAAVEVVAAIVSMAFVDRLGRWLLLLMSGGSMAASTALLGCFFFYKDYRHEDLSSLSWLPLIAVSFYMFMFSVGFGPVIWVFLGEIFPDDVKGVATAVASCTGWLWCFLVTKFYPGLAVAVGTYSCYWAFFVLSVVSCLYVAVSMPETKGKTLDEIQAELS